MFDVKRLKIYKNELGEIYMGEIKIFNMLWVLLIVLLVRCIYEINVLYL